LTEKPSIAGAGRFASEKARQRSTRVLHRRRHGRVVQRKKKEVLALGSFYDARRGKAGCASSAQDERKALGRAAGTRFGRHGGRLSDAGA
jgi:hypothetical protein